MNKRFVGKLKSELALKIRDAMNKKGISTYRELIEKSGVSINNHFSNILTGKQSIKEKDLIKISQILEIPMDFFKINMREEVRYRVEEYIPIIKEENKHHKVLLTDEERRAKVREYNRIYKKKQRAKLKTQKEEISKII